MAAARLVRRRDGCVPLRAPWPPFGVREDCPPGLAVDRLAARARARRGTHRCTRPSSAAGEALALNNHAGPASTAGQDEAPTAGDDMTAGPDRDVAAIRAARQTRRDACPTGIGPRIAAARTTARTPHKSLSSATEPTRNPVSRRRLGAVLGDAPREGRGLSTAHRLLGGRLAYTAVMGQSWDRRAGFQRSTAVLSACSHACNADPGTGRRIYLLGAGRGHQRASRDREGAVGPGERGQRSPQGPLDAGPLGLRP